MGKIKRRYFLKQKAIGLFVAILSAMSIFIEMDGTWALIGIPAGLYCLFTKEMVLWDEDKILIEESEEDEGLI